MKKVDKDVLKDAASRLLFDMKDEEYDTLLDEFDIITRQLKLMDDIPGLNEVEPMSFPYDLKISLLREDVVGKNILSKEEVLSEAKDVRDGQIELPKVVG